MKEFENLKYLSYEKALKDYIQEIDLPAYSIKLMLENILREQVEKYEAEVQRENEIFARRKQDIEKETTPRAQRPEQTMDEVYGESEPQPEPQPEN